MQVTIAQDCIFTNAQVKKCRLKLLRYRLRWELRLCPEVLTNMLTKMLTIRANADYCLQDGKMEVRALRTIHPEEEVCLYWLRWCWYFCWCWRLGIWWRCRRSRRLWTRLLGKIRSYDHHSKHCRLPFATPTFWKRTAPSQGEREKLIFCGHIGWSVQIEHSCKMLMLSQVWVHLWGL